MAEELLARLTPTGDHPKLEEPSFQYSKGGPRLHRQDSHRTQHQSSFNHDHDIQNAAQEQRHDSRPHNHSNIQKHTGHRHRHKYDLLQHSRGHRPIHSSASSSFTPWEGEGPVSDVKGEGGGEGGENGSAQGDRREDGVGYKERQIFEVKGGHFSPRSSSHHAHKLPPPPLSPPLSLPLSPPPPPHSSDLHRRIMEKSSSTPSLFKWSPSRSASLEDNERNLEVSRSPSSHPKNRDLGFSSRSRVFPWTSEVRPSPTPRYSTEDLFRMGAQPQQIPRRHLTSTTSSGLLDVGNESLSILATADEQEPEESLGEIIGNEAGEDDFDNEDDDAEVEYEEEDDDDRVYDEGKQEIEEILEEINMKKSMMQLYLEMEEPLDERKVSRRNAKHAATAEDRQRRRERKRKRERKREEIRGEREKKLAERPKTDYDRFQHVDDNGDVYMDCCPSKMVVGLKMVGKKADGNTAVEINPDQQFFYERVCLEEFLGKECLFPARTIRKHAATRCVQLYSHSQALVRTYQSNDTWKVDYIQVRSGCSCQIMVSKKTKKRKKKRKKKKMKKKRVEKR
ncbi:uncharacterized protein LOC143028417 isoform X2 [Oratosquilla oratoria]